MSLLQQLFGPLFSKKGSEAAPPVESLRDKHDVDGLIEALDRHSEACCTAAEALGQIGDQQAVESLIAVVKSNDVRKAAARALGQIGDARAAEPLRFALKNDDIPQVAAEALAEIGAPAVEPLLATLQTRDLKIRWTAAEALGGIGAPAVEPLIAALQGDDEDVRPAAAWALGQIGNEQAVESLTGALKNDANEEVRRIAAKELGESNDRRAVKPLIAALGDECEEVREAAAAALEDITDQDFGEDAGRWQSWWMKQMN